MYLFHVVYCDSGLLEHVCIASLISLMGPRQQMGLDTLDVEIRV